MDREQFATLFVKHYYTTFDNNRPALAGLYLDSSMLTFDGEEIKGVLKITAKLNISALQECKHIIHSFDHQPSCFGGMHVLVNGQLLLAGQSQTFRFTQMFHLMPTPQGGYYVLNDIFRITMAEEVHPSQNQNDSGHAVFLCPIIM